MEQNLRLAAKIGLKEEWLLPALYQQQALEYSHYYRHIPETCRVEFSKQIKTVAAPEVYEIFLRSLPVASWKKYGASLLSVLKEIIGLSVTFYSDLYPFSKFAPTQIKK